MTMHMLPAYYTTTSLKKKKAGKRTAALIKATADHEKFLKKMGIKGDKCSGSTASSNLVRVGSTPTSPANQLTGSIPVGVAVKPEPKIYNGKRKLLGIATMHKSCLVPVFGKEQAIEIAKMRRG
jgi:hypothetical protein